MAGKVTLPLAVEIGFGCGPMDPAPTWTDVSAYVQRAKSISLSRGVDQESGEPIAGRAQLRLRNPDGRFTPGRTGAHGLVRNKLPIRVRRGATVLWTGLIEKLAMGFEAGVRAIVDVTCVDRWARFTARKLTDERMRPLILGQAPAYFWPMTDEAGADRAAELVGGADWVPAGGDNFGPLNPASAPNPQLGNTTNVAGAANSGFLRTLIPAGTAAWTVAAWLNAGLLGMNDLLPPSPQNYVIMDNAGAGGCKVQTCIGGAAGTFTGPAVPSGWHHLAVTASLSAGTTTLRFYIDGALAWTTTAAGTLTANLVWMWASAAGVGYIAAFTRALTAAEIAEQFKAAQLGWAGDTADVRAGRVRALNGMWPLTTHGGFTSTMSKPTFTGKTLAQALVECATAEAGTLFLDRDGWPVLQSRTARTGSALAATIPNTVLASDAQWELDDQALVNVVTVDRMVADTTATTVTRRNEPSIADYDESEKSVQVWLDTDAQTVERANAEANLHAVPLPRSRSFTVDLATCQTAVSEATILGLDIGSRIALSGLPSQAPDVVTSWYVDQIDDQISHTEWKRTLTVSPGRDFFKLQDATFGALDGIYSLGF